MVDQLFALRDAAFLAFFVQGGARPSHYIRFAGVGSEVVVDWAPQQAWTERDAFCALSAYRAISHLPVPQPATIDLRLGEVWNDARRRDDRRFTAFVRLLYASRLEPWYTDHPMDVSEFNRRCQTLADDEARRQFADSEFGSMIGEIHTRLLQGKAVLRGGTVAQLAVRALGGMEGRVVGGYVRSPAARAFEDLFLFGR